MVDIVNLSNLNFSYKKKQEFCEKKSKQYIDY